VRHRGRDHRIRAEQDRPDDDPEDQPRLVAAAGIHHDCCGECEAPIGGPRFDICRLVDVLKDHRGELNDVTAA